MSENIEKKIANIVIVTEQLEQIDIIEKSLKDKFAVNSYSCNNATEFKKILSKENIAIAIVDDADGTIGIGSVRNAANELKIDVPIIQLEHAGSTKTDSEFLRNGATIVCPGNDSYAILHNFQLLIDYSHGQKTLSKGESATAEYRERFDDLYHSLADPVCFVQDGIFLDTNPAFLRTFEIADAEELDELTILNFIERKHQNELKTHLRKSSRRDLSTSPVTFNLKTKLGKEMEFSLMSKPVSFEGEKVVQVYLRSTTESGGAGSTLYDETTGLSNRDQMAFFLNRKIEQFNQNDGTGFLAYIMINNYRDVWGSDGFIEAEKFIKAIAHQVRKTLPAHTELSRYTDDGFLMYIPGEDPKEISSMLTKLIEELDVLTPEGMARMVEARCYGAFNVFNKESNFLKEIGDLFRTSRNAGQTENARISRPTTSEVAQKDSVRVQILQEIIQGNQLSMQFQPIASFDPDGTERYRERLGMFHEEMPDLELEYMIGVAERYELMHKIDMWKMTTLFNKFLAMDVEKRKDIVVFVSLSVDSMKSEKFSTWIVEQIMHTGLDGRHFVFEFMVDNVINAYSGAMRLNKALKKSGTRVAVTKISGMSEDNTRVVNDIKPNIIKLDIREIDTLDESEEPEIMGEIKSRAEEHDALIIAEYLESPAQLSRIWPYDIKFIQGDGMTPLLDDVNFNFNEFEL